MSKKSSFSGLTIIKQTTMVGKNAQSVEKRKWKIRGANDLLLLYSPKQIIETDSFLKSFNEVVHHCVIMEETKARKNSVETVRNEESDIAMKGRDLTLKAVLCHFCTVCRKYFATKNSLQKHWDICHERFESKRTESGLGEAIPKLVPISLGSRQETSVECKVVLCETQLIEGSSKKERKFYCDPCLKFFSSHQTLKKHRMMFHDESYHYGKILCRFCGKSVPRPVVNNHEKKCGKVWDNRQRQTCSFNNCNASFYRKESLLKHLQVSHNMEIEPLRTLKFQSEEDFKNWKENMEDDTYSLYTKHAGAKKNCTTYYCQREGSDKAHRGRQDTREISRRNKKGRVKTGKSCTSFIRVKYNENEVIATYSPTHSHPVSPDDVQHHPLSVPILKYVKEQLLLNVPARQIQAAVKKRVAEGHGGRKRDALITVKSISNMARRMRLRCELDSDILDQFTTFVDVLCAQEDSPIMLYHPPNGQKSINSNEEDDSFYLGLQSVDQQKMLQRDSAMPMFISYVKSDFTLHYYVITLVVHCENNFEYPVGHLISSQMDEEVITLFLQAIGDRCPDLNVNCIVSVDCPEINNAIRRVFGPDGPYYLSKWHFLHSIKKDFLSTVASNNVEELFDFILAMADAESEEKFLFLFNSFKEQYESKFPSVISNFNELFARSSAWASCYRQFPGMIDSCLNVDSFQHKLNKLYNRRPNKTLSLVLELLLQMQDNYRERRENKKVSVEGSDLMEQQHQMALEIPLEFVQEIFLHHWTVQSAKHGQVFKVMQCLSKCNRPSCALKCKDCGHLCSHMYFCSCGKSEFICMHVHKIFLEFGSKSESEENFDADDVNETEPMEEENQEDCTFVLMEDQATIDSNEEAQESSNESRKLSILNTLEVLKESIKLDCLPDNYLCIIDDTLKNLLVNSDILAR